MIEEKNCDGCCYNPTCNRIVCCYLHKKENKCIIGEKNNKEEDEWGMT